MPIEFYKTISISVAAGTTGEGKFKPPIDVKIGKIMATERAAANLENVFGYIEIAGKVFTKEPMPLACFGCDYETALPVEKDLPSGQLFYIKITNNLTTGINVDIVLQCLTP